MPEPVTLEHIFGAFVTQDTLEDAAREMAIFAKNDPELLREITVALSDAINSGVEQDEAVLKAIHHSGYRVSGAVEARQYCSQLLDMFRAQLANGP